MSSNSFPRVRIGASHSLETGRIAEREEENIDYFEAFDIAGVESVNTRSMDLQLRPSFVPIHS
jgi:hypothetical protein